MNRNESIDLELIQSEEEDREEDVARYKITTYGADYTLEILSNKIDEGEIVIPQFQRRYVWNIKKASKLIESFLLGLPVPQVFLYREDESQNLLVVDGQQRLKTINYFFNGIFEDDKVFKLTGVKEEWEGKRFQELEEADRRKLKNYILRANIFEQTDPQDDTSVYEIFERLNTGGVALTQQEIRNCVIHGAINDFLAELNEYEGWRKVLGKNYPDARMKDVEMILRFFALLEGRDDYKKPMKDFISSFMKSKSNISEKEKERYRKIFTSVVDFINKHVDRPFRLKAGINIAIFDSIMVAISEIGVSNILDFPQKYQSLIADDEYLESVSKSTTDPDRVSTRIEKAIEIFRG